jgi:hypothetical protein
VLQVVTNVGTVIACYAQCSDPRALYDFSLPESLCWPAEVQTVSPLLPLPLPRPCGLLPLGN